MMKALAVAGVVALVAVAYMSASRTGASNPDFRLVSGHWLLCPTGAADLTTCCPQPADPRRCVVPSNSTAVGVAPLALMAFGRFKKFGTSGGATATFSTVGSGRAECSVVLPFTPSGGTVAAWCSLGSALEVGSEPQVSVDNRRQARSSP